MRKSNVNQFGFSVIELLLIVLVVAAVAVTGLVVYQRHKTSKSNAATGSTQSTGQSQSTTSTQPPATTYLNIKEWGVRVPYSGSLKLSYTMSADLRTATFSSDQLTALSTDCAGRGGFITRWASNEQVSERPADASTPTAASYFAKAAPSSYAHIGNYYFMFAHDQSACGDLTTTTALQSQTNDAVKALVPNLQAAPSTQTVSQYLDIKEWSIKVKLEDADKLTYTMNGTPNGASADADGIVSYAALSLKDSITTSPKCKPLTTSITQHFASSNVGEGANMTTVGKYAYGIDGGPNSCDDSAINALQQKIFSELLKRNIVAE